MIHAFISDGRLFVRNQQGRIDEIESPFVNEKQISSERHTKYHSWKDHSNSGDACFNPSIVWGGQLPAVSARSYRFRDVAAVGEDTLYYILADQVITGLFRYDLADGFETRLFHRNDLFECGFDFSPSRQEFVIAVQQDDMRCSLELFNKTGSAITELTGGDSRDSYPSFCYRNPNRILFQSAGLSRDETGFPVLFGPEAIHCLDLDAEEIEEVLADDRYDYLLPKEDAEGNLYFIRRPYQGPGQHSFGKIFFDTIFFPFRFLIAVVGFLDAFTKLFNQQSFKADGPNVQFPRQEKHVRILGQTIRMAKVHRDARFKRELSLVPGSWELIRRDINGHFEVMARHAAFYDIDAEGVVYVTNGYRVHIITPSEKKTLFRHSLVEMLKVARS